MASELIPTDVPARIEVPRLRIAPVAASDLPLVWDEIRPHLEALCAKRDCRFRPEDVYTACKTAWNQATLFRVLDGFETLVAFYVAMVMPELFRPERYLFVWILCGVPDLDWETRQAAWEFIPAQFDTLARSLGLARIRHEAIRPGWQRKAAGFRCRTWVMEKELV